MVWTDESDRKAGNLTKRTIGILLVSVSALGLVIWTACESTTSKQLPAPSVENLTLGTSAHDLSSLIWIAKARGYFSEQGLNIDFKLYESGHLALKDLLAGKLDFATATEFAAVRHGIAHPDFRIISILDEAQDQQLVARRDHGITQISDLRNKRVGVTRDTSAEYYLHLLLILEKIRIEDVRIVHLLPSEQAQAIAGGDIDAVMVWEPFASKIKEDLGTNAVSWPSQSGQDEYWLLLSTAGVIERLSLAIKRFLAALVSAEALIENDETEAVGIVARQLEGHHLGSLWRNHRFRLGLHRPLVLKMEAELKWLQPSAGARQSSAPDLYEFVHSDALNSMESKRIRVLY
jgi:ABC-type nitrate/sulfonate/bicarbonate transport system substrate-binding protein